MRQKSTGTLVLDALTPAKRLFMISTGTGIAPFASLLRDPDTYEKFDEVILTHTCRDNAELAYGEELVAALANDPLIGELADGRVTLYNSTTREDLAAHGPHHRADRDPASSTPISASTRSIPRPTAS